MSFAIELFCDQGTKRRAILGWSRLINGDEFLNFFLAHFPIGRRALNAALDLETGSALRREAPLWLFVAVPMAVVGIAGGAVLAARRAIADLF